MSAFPVAGGGAACRGLRTRVAGRPGAGTRGMTDPAAGALPIGAAAMAAAVVVAAAAVCGLALAALPAPLAAQASGGPARARRPDDADRLLYRVGIDLGFLITSGEGFGDRPDVGLTGAVQLGRALRGGGPAVGLTGSVTVGASEFMGGSFPSLRALAGVELPWSVGRGLELVPSGQVGYLEALDEDERAGFTSRWTVGLRVLPSNSPFYFELTPIALVSLPLPDDGAGARVLQGGAAPGGRAAGPGRGGRFVPELGILRFGWRF